ncbi:MAG: hypothetical protein MJ252_15085, partial [archaeon]|nr:hypothetical protein [archaeon]
MEHPNQNDYDKSKSNIQEFVKQTDEKLKKNYERMRDLERKERELNFERMYKKYQNISNSGSGSQDNSDNFQNRFQGGEYRSNMYPQSEDDIIYKSNRQFDKCYPPQRNMTEFVNKYGKGPGNNLEEKRFFTYEIDSKACPGLDFGRKIDRVAYRNNDIGLGNLHYDYPNRNRENKYLGETGGIGRSDGFGGVDSIYNQNYEGKQNNQKYPKNFNENQMMGNEGIYNSNYSKIGQGQRGEGNINYNNADPYNNQNYLNPSEKSNNPNYQNNSNYFTLRDPNNPIKGGSISDENPNMNNYNKYSENQRPFGSNEDSKYLNNPNNNLGSSDYGTQGFNNASGIGNNSNYANDYKDPYNRNQSDYDKNNSNPLGKDSYFSYD